MQHLSLFSGIGGFDLAAHWAGWQTVATCEVNDWCRQVLAAHFPNAYHHDNVKTLTADIVYAKAPQTDPSQLVLSGGFPCQPFSAAGKRLGTSDDRHLWPEMLRVITSIRPKWVVGENVAGLLNWQEGLVHQEACADLEAEGYETATIVLPACAVGAPHRRDRVWIVAHAKQDRRGFWSLSNAQNSSEARRDDAPTTLRSLNALGKTANTARLYAQGFSDGQGQTQPWRNNVQPSDWRGFPTQSPVCSRNDGVPAGLDRRAYRRHARNSIQAYGNAIVPQVAYRIFQFINQHPQLP